MFGAAPRLAFALFFLVAAYAEDNLKFGQPACSGRVLDKAEFVICHSSENKIPIWVGYALTREDLARHNAERTDNYRADPVLPAGERAELADYRGISGLDRGHMAPAEDFTRSRTAMSTTFLLSNMAPQRLRLNRGRWKQLEAAVRNLAASHGSVWIFTGPAFAGKKPIRTIGRDQVAVPSHFYKVVLCVHADGTKEMSAVLMPNISQLRTDPASYAQTVNFIENLTGLNFFSALPDDEENRLERTVGSLPAP